MALIEQKLAELDTMLSEPLGEAGTRPVIAELRRRLPGLVFMGCDASDVLEEPYRSYAGIDLHLIDTRNHCAEMTQDPRHATGILLARKVAA